MEEGEKRCWECQNQIESAALWCSSCGALQPCSDDPFRCFDLDDRLHIDLELLRSRFHALSRQFHPDFFQQKSPQAQAISLENSAKLNAAYRTLKDSVSRATYLVRLVAGEKEVKPIPSSELFAEILDLEEALEAVESDAADPTARATLIAARERFRARLETVQVEMAALFTEWDTLLLDRSRHWTVAQRECIARLRQTLSHRGYLDRMLQKITQVVGEETESDFRKESVTPHRLNPLHE